jgi:hypothetical protein
MQRFMEEVAPRLREESKAMYAERYGRELDHPRALVGAAR